MVQVRELIESPGFSGVVSVVVDGQSILQHASGLANREVGIPNASNTRFATASVSKIFTALCVARLVEVGRCRFDQSLPDIVPQLRLHYDDTFTLASLLCHRAGLGDYIDDDAALPFAGMDVARLDSTGAFLPHVLQVPRYAPGEFRYSSAGYILLGLVIETLTGKSYPEAVAEWVTGPAGMIATGFPPLDGPCDDVAIGYLPDGTPNFNHIPRVGGADGGIVTTVADLQALFRGMAGRDFISEATKQFLWQPLSPLKAQQAYGHGFYIDEVAGRTWYGHTGSDPGVSARVAFTQDPYRSIVVLCNVESVAFRTFRLILESLEETGGKAY